LIEPDDYTLAISLNWSQEEDDVVMIKETSDPEIIHTLPMQELLVREAPPLWKFQVSFMPSLLSFGFEITHPLRISNNLPRGDYRYTFQNLGVAVIQPVIYDPAFKSEIFIVYGESYPTDSQTRRIHRLIYMNNT